MAYGFRPATFADVPMLRRWLETPEVRRWWGDPDEQQKLIEEDLAGDLMTQLIVSFEGRSFAYVQHCEVHAWPQTPFADLPRGSRAIDPLIGEPAMLSRGHGSAFLRQLGELLIAGGAPMLAIDPDLANEAACRAYRKAGFVDQGVVDTQDGPALLMLWRAPGAQ